MRLSFLQANWLRQYPFRKDSGITDVNQLSMPTDIIVGLRLAIPHTGNLVYINRVSTNSGVVSVEFSAGSALIGYASGSITQANTALPVIAYGNSGSIGTVTIGNPDSCQPAALYIFNNTVHDPAALSTPSAMGFVEPSTVTSIVPPVVTSWSIRSQALTGNLTLTSDSLSIGSNLQLMLLAPQDVVSLGDQHPEYLTCSHTVIGSLNNVFPSDYNINIVAIEPLVITSVGNGVFQLTVPEVVLTDPTSEQVALCKQYNIPPDTETSIPTGDLLGTTPEYPTWPQFNQS